MARVLARVIARVLLLLFVALPAAAQSWDLRLGGRAGAVSLFSGNSSSGTAVGVEAVLSRGRFAVSPSVEVARTGHDSMRLLHGDMQVRFARGWVGLGVTHARVEDRGNDLRPNVNAGFTLPLANGRGELYSALRWFRIDITEFRVDYSTHALIGSVGYRFKL